jgi:hypothetical protein
VEFRWILRRCGFRGRRHRMSFRRHFAQPRPPIIPGWFVERINCDAPAGWLVCS